MEPYDIYTGKSRKMFYCLFHLNSVIIVEPVRIRQANDIRNHKFHFGTTESENKDPFIHPILKITFKIISIVFKLPS